MAIAQVAKTAQRFIERSDLDKLLAIAIGTGIGLGQSVDNFGEYISRKRKWDDFTKPRRRKGEVALDGEIQKNVGTNQFNKALRTNTKYRRNVRRRTNRKSRKCCC